MSEQDDPGREDEHRDGSQPPEPKRLLGFGAAMGLYAVLALLSLLTLTGNFRTFMLIVLGAIAVMTYTHRMREKLGIKRRSRWGR